MCARKECQSFDVVTGKKTDVHFCSAFRITEGVCGKSAKYFESGGL